MNDALCETMPELLADLLHDLGQVQEPYVLFGHSLGALLAFELAHALREKGMQLPLAVLASGTNAPSRRDRDARYAQLQCDDDLMAELRELNGTPPEVFNHPEILELILPILRADFKVCGGYRYQARDKLACPIHVFGGRQDATSHEALMAWQVETSAGFSLDMLDGDHFFINSEESSLLALISERCKALRDTSRLVAEAACT